MKNLDKVPVKEFSNGFNRRLNICCKIDPLRYKEIHLPDSNNLGLGRKMDDAIWLYTRYRTGLVYIHCRVTNRFYMGLFDIRDVLNDGFTLSLLTAYEPLITADFTLYGLGEFEFRIIGFYESKVEALNYRDFLINHYLDKGFEMYGNDVIDGIVPRFVVLKLNQKILSRLMVYCNEKGKSFNKLLHSLIYQFLKSRT